MAGTALMIVKMSLITLAYVAVTFLLWKTLRDRKLTLGDKIGLGVLYGILCIFSTHLIEGSTTISFSWGKSTFILLEIYLE